MILDRQMLLLVMQGSYVYRGWWVAQVTRVLCCQSPKLLGWVPFCLFWSLFGGQGDEQEALCWEWWDRRVHRG